MICACKMATVTSLAYLFAYIFYHCYRYIIGLIQPSAFQTFWVVKLLPIGRRGREMLNKASLFFLWISHAIFPETRVRVINTRHNVIEHVSCRNICVITGYL